MVPIRQQAPVGSIGNYWATPHLASAGEVFLLQALADSTSVAIENVGIYQDLERRVRERTRQLEEANQDLEAFASAISHDLRSPLHTMGGFVELLESGAAGPDKIPDYLGRVSQLVEVMNQRIDDLLRLAHISFAPLAQERIVLSNLARSVAANLDQANPGVNISFEIAPALEAEADPGLMRAALENLLSNAWKFSSRVSAPRVEFGRTDADPEPAFFIRDNGAGFDMAMAHRLFLPFQRLHTADDYQGTGIGLATVAQIIRRHGGRIWADSAPGKGATFYFTLPG